MNSALCYAKVIDDAAVEQIKKMCDQLFSENSIIRIMPDVHAGSNCTIGTTMTITDKVVPNIVGVDIGCGMYVVNLGKVEIDFEKVDEAAHYIPSGIEGWKEKRADFNFEELYCFHKLKRKNRIGLTLGTLGGGNHFIEVDRSQDGTKYLIIHTGSRSLGKNVAEFYQQLAIDLNKGKETYEQEKQQIIRTYKEQGREKEIEKALKDISWINRKTTIPEEMCYLYGEYLSEYMHDVEICQRFARKNREIIAEIIMEKAGLTNCGSFHTVHNYIDSDEMILRKGAIAAHKGEKVLIPVNMRDGCILAIGKGNPDWNYSAPHGAGRILSRKQAKAKLDINEYKKAMQGIYTTSISETTLDEAPMAYKSLEDILDVIRESVDVIDIMKPVYNFKSS